MNLDSSSASSSNPPAARTTRGAIAAQACDTCRARKQKCDEQRPKCSLCQRMKLECNYREPQPTKKDKTLVEILGRLKSLEGKVDQLSTQPPPQPPLQVGFGPPPPSPNSQPSFIIDAVEQGSYSVASAQPSTQRSPSDVGLSLPYRHASAAHKILVWPAIRQLLSEALPSNMGDLSSLEQEGSVFIMRIHEGTPRLALDEALQDRPFVGMQSQATRAAGGARTTFPGLTREIMHQLATAYFDSFNFIYPFMDRQNFILDTLTKVHTEGFDGDTDSVIALLVFALGELAIDSVRGNPIEVHKGRASGIRGGTVSKPPGLALFNEARKRIGFVLTECDLENVQIYSLAALYCESCSYHVDFWRLTLAASLACNILVTCKPINWDLPRGDLIKRAYWHCVMMETGLHLELDLQPTGLIALEDRVGIPSFNSPFCEADHRGNQSSHFEAHYASQVALRRLCANLHRAINEFMINTNADNPSSSENFGGPSANSLKQLAGQLNQWFGMLPRDLQWAEDDPASFPTPQPAQGSFNQSLDPNLSPQYQPQSSGPLFTTDLNSDPVQYAYAYDIQVAVLRTRYYYAKYTVYRPFLYKALHFPELMTQEDAEGVAECLRACLKWPLALSPPSRHKRLVPYLFCWSQNFLSILIIFHMTQHNPMLRDIRAQLCGPRFEAEIGDSTAMMLDWIRDMKSTDPIAMWCWKILQGIYQIEE